MRMPIRSLIVLALLGLSVLACAEEPADLFEEAEETVSTAAAESTQTYDLEIELYGLIGYVPVGTNGGTAGADDTAKTLWGILVNATEPANVKPPCVEQAPYPQDKNYHPHFPRLHFNKKYLPDGPATAGIYIQNDTAKKDLAGLQIEFESEAFTPAGVKLAGPRVEKCSQTNAASFRCVPHLAQIAPSQAEICKDCLKSIANQPLVNKYIAARVKLTHGTLATKHLEYGEEGELLHFTFAGTGEETTDSAGRAWKWTNRVKAFDKQPLAGPQTLTIENLEGPLTVHLKPLDGSPATSVSLEPSGDPIMHLRLLNLTCAGLKDCGISSPPPPAPYDGREFRWFYNLSKNRPADKECETPLNPLLPSLVTHAGPESPPICPKAVFEAPSSS